MVNAVFGKIFHFFVLWLAVSVLMFFVQLMVHSGLSEFIIYVLNDLLPFDAMLKEKITIASQMWLYTVVLLATVPFYLYAVYFMMLSLVEKYEAIHLKREINALVAEGE